MNSTAQTLLTLAVLHFIAAASPGPNTLIVIRNALHEKKLGIISASGIWPVGIIWAIFAMFGLGAILTTTPQLAQVMYLLCGSYLIYLGIKLIYYSLKSEQNVHLRSAHKPSAREAFTAGFISNATNPKAIAYWMSIFAATNATKMPMTDQVLAILMMPTISFGWYWFLSSIVSSNTVQAYLGTQRHWIDRVAGMVMLGFGIRLLIFLLQ